MKSFHTMDTQRITISLPGYIYKRLRKTVPSRGISQFVAKSVERELMSIKKEDPIESFFELQDHFPKLTMKQILKAIRKGRT